MSADIRVVATLGPITATSARTVVDAAADAGVAGVFVRVEGSTRRAALPFELSDFDAGASRGLPSPDDGLAPADVAAVVAAASARAIDVVLSVADAGALAVARLHERAVVHVDAAALLDLPFIASAVRDGGPLWLDTAMASLDEVAEALASAVAAGARPVLLHGLVTTPGRPEELNLRALATLRERFVLPVGWHARDATSALVTAALALGATVVAVPFDPAGKGGFDAVALAGVCADAALVGRALGDGDKRVQQSEWAARDRAHSSLVARVDIARGRTLTGEMLTTAPPGIGLKPRAARSLVGRRAAVDIAAGTLITLGMLE